MGTIECVVISALFVSVSEERQNAYCLGTVVFVRDVSGTFDDTTILLYLYLAAPVHSFGSPLSSCIQPRDL